MSTVGLRTYFTPLACTCLVSRLTRYLDLLYQVHEVHTQKSRVSDYNRLHGSFPTLRNPTVGFYQLSASSADNRSSCQS